MSLSMWTWRVVLPGAGLLLALAVLGASFRPEGPEKAEPSPADDSKAARPASADRVIAEGRLAPKPGAEVTVGTESGGTVVNLPARETARVRKGDLLVEFRSDDQKAALAIAEARLAEADADFGFQQREYQRRVRSTADSKHFSTELDNARHDYEVAAARKRAAASAVEQARSALGRTRITAPIDGVILALFVQPGEVAAPGARLVTVCDLARTWIEAEVDEFDAPRVAPGAEVAITAEGQGPASWRGTVAEIPGRVAGRSISPEDPGRPTDTRVLLVKIAPAEPLPLKLGQQVEVSIRAAVGGAGVGSRQ